MTRDRETGAVGSVRGGRVTRTAIQGQEGALGATRGTARVAIPAPPAWRLDATVPPRRHAAPALPPSRRGLRPTSRSSRSGVVADVERARAPVRPLADPATKWSRR